MMSAKKNIPKEKSMSKTVSGWLYGWKDIANYIGCDVVTVRKYVSESKFPIHRFPNKNKIFGIPSEIDQWGMRCKKT